MHSSHSRIQVVLFVVFRLLNGWSDFWHHVLPDWAQSVWGKGSHENNWWTWPCTGWSPLTWPRRATSSGVPLDAPCHPCHLCHVMESWHFLKIISIIFLYLYHFLSVLFFALHFCAVLPLPSTSWIPRHWGSVSHQVRISRTALNPESWHDRWSTDPCRVRKVRMHLPYFSILRRISWCRLCSTRFLRIRRFNMPWSWKTILDGQAVQAAVILAFVILEGMTPWKCLIDLD